MNGAKIKMNQNQKNIKVDVETHQKIKYLARTLNVKQNNFIKELIEQIFAVACTYETANVVYYPCISASYVTVQFSGKNRLISGSNKSMDEDELEALIERKLVNNVSNKKSNKAKVSAYAR
jgi:hypothetical protein